MENEKQGIQLVKIKMVDDAFLDLGEHVGGTKQAFQAGLKTIAKEVGSFDREVLFALNLNNKNQIINANIVTMGTINSSLFSPRDIFKSAILSNAVRVILYHNHPSGDLTPSIADIQSTQRAIEAGKYIGIEVLDHIISNQKGEMLSLREEAESQFLSFDEIENLTIREIREEVSISENYTIEESKATYSRKTKEQKEEELKQLADKIQTKVNEFVMNPEIIKDYLLFKRQFREYSMNNTILIYSERPDALGVGTYKFWQKKGHSVKRGEKGIGIYAPILKDYIVDKAGHPVSKYEEATPEQLQKLTSKEYSKRTVPVGFTKKYVFDITQTSTPIEDYPKLIKEGYELDNKNDYQVQNIAINRLVGKSGLKLIDYDKARTGKSAQGYFIPATKEIYLQPDLTSIARFKTLVHETAHGILHGVKNNLTTGEKEFQAQMVSLVVSDTLGLPMKDGDYGYVKSYQRDITDERKRELLDGVFKVADLVLESYEETLELIKANELSIEEKQEIERLQLDLPTLSKTDIQEIVHYPSTEQQKYFLATKIIKKNVENMSVEEKENYYKEAEAFLRNKVEKNHKHYQVGLLNEATLTRREDNKLELVITNIKGNSEKQVFDEEEQVVELLSKKEAVPVSENAMVYTKNKVENKLGQEKQLERTQQQVRERGL